MADRKLVYAISWPLFVVGLGLVMGAFFVPAEATPAGGRTLEGWWAAMGGVSLIVSGLGWPPAWRKSALLTGLFILSLTAQLTLTRPH